MGMWEGNRSIKHRGLMKDWLAEVRSQYQLLLAVFQMSPGTEMGQT